MTNTIYPGSSYYFSIQFDWDKEEEYHDIEIIAEAPELAQDEAKQMLSELPSWLLAHVTEAAFIIGEKESADNPTWTGWERLDNAVSLYPLS